MSATSVDFVPTTPEEVVYRAKFFVGQGWYKLGAGARWDQTSPFDGKEPFDKAGNQFPGFCDCSGFTAWAARYRRGPWNTDAITADARARHKRFRLVGRDEHVRPSDFIVYPGPDKDHDGERDSPGHIGIIVEVAPDFAAIRGKADWWEHLKIAHCTPRSQVKLGAIKLTDATLWVGRGYIVRPLHLQYAEAPEQAA